MASCTIDKRGFFNQPHGHFFQCFVTRKRIHRSLCICQNLTKTWRMRMQLLPGLIFAGSDIKAKIRPGIETKNITRMYTMCRKCLARSRGCDMLAIVAMTGRCPDSFCCMVFTTVQLLAFADHCSGFCCFFLGEGLRAAACVITHLSAYRSGGQCTCNYSMGNHKINEKCTYFACSMFWRSC